jgi:hypothetical protein
VETNGFDVSEAIPQKWDELPTIPVEVDGINSSSYSLDSTQEQLLTEVVSAFTAIPIPGFNLEVDVDTTELSVGSHEFTLTTKTKGGAMERQQNATIEVVRDTKDGQRDIVYNLINRTINPNWWYGQASNKLLSIIIDDPIKYTKDPVTGTIKSFRSGSGSIIKQTLRFLQHIYNNRLKPSLNTNSRVKVGNILFDGTDNVDLSTIRRCLIDIPIDIRNDREKEARSKVIKTLDDIRIWKPSIKSRHNRSPERDSALATLDAAETTIERDKQMLPSSNVPLGAVYSDPNSTPARFDTDANGEISQGELIDGLQLYSNDGIDQGELVDLLRAHSRSN